MEYFSCAAPPGLARFSCLPTLPASHSLASGWANFATRLRRWRDVSESFFSSLSISKQKKHKVPHPYSRAGTIARELMGFGMTNFIFADGVFYSPYVHPYFLWRFFGFVWLVSFFNRTHVAVPISLSPLVAFAPAGESEMGTKERSSSGSLSFSN
jgi:hypothetical protein